MNAELQAATQAPQSASRNARAAQAASREIIRWLCVNWHEVERNLGEISVPEWLRTRPGKPRAESDLARLAYAGEIVRRPLASFNDLAMAEALRLVKHWNQELGREFKPRGMGYQGARRRPAGRPAIPARVSDGEILKIAEMAADLWGSRWSELLTARAADRFRVHSPQSLTPGQARSLVEELLQRLAVRQIADRHQPPISREEIEAEKAGLRARYFLGAGQAPPSAPGKAGAASRPPMGEGE